MPRWTEGDVVKISKEVAQKSVTTKRPINETVEKVAREQSLSPNEIRSLTRLTNIAAYQIYFAEKTGADRQVEFEVGDAEAIIQRIHQRPVLPESANIHNDKLASANDYDLKPVIEVEKIAFDEAETLKPRQATRTEWEKARNELHIEKLAYGLKWADAMTEIHKTYRKFNDAEKLAFEADILVNYGEQGRAAIGAIYMLDKRLPPSIASEKIAALQDVRVAKSNPFLDRVKVALDIRADYQKLEAAVAKIDAEQLR